MIKVQRVAIEISVKKRCRLVVVVDCAYGMKKCENSCFSIFFCKHFTTISYIPWRLD